MPLHDQSQKHLDKANELTRQKKFNAAFREFEAAIRRHYGNSKAYADFGYALVKAGRYPEAIEQFKKAAELDSDIAFNKNLLRAAFEHDIRQKQDLDEFKRIVDTAGSHELIHTWAQVLTDLQRDEPALEEFKKALTKNPELNLNISSVAQAIENSGDTEQQVQAFQTLVDGLKNAKAWNTWGLTLLSLRRYTTAADQFRKAADASKDWAEPHLNLGNTFTKLSDYQAAIDALQKALSYDERCTETYLELGHALYEHEKYEEAVATYKVATTKAPSALYFEPWLEAIRKLPNPESALPDYRQALNKSDEITLLSWARIGYGTYLKERGRLAKSAVEFARSVALDSDERAQFNLQETISEIEAPYDTLEIIESIFDKCGDPERYAQWIVILIKSNQADRAIQQLPRVLKDLPMLDFPGEVLTELAIAFKSAKGGSVGLSRIEGELNKIGNGSLQVEWAEILRTDLDQRERSLNLYKKLLLELPRSMGLVQDFTEALQSSPNQSSEIADVRAAVNRIAGNNIADADVCYHWALILIQLKQPQAAREELERAITLDRNHADAHFELGRQYNIEGDYIAARRQFQQTLELDQTRIDAVQELGTALLNCGQKEEAIEKYLEAIRMGAGTFQSLDLLAIRESLTWDDKVVERFQQAFDEINQAGSYREWGSFLVKVKHPRLAIEQFKKAIELDPDELVIHFDWLKALGACGLPSELIDEYQQFLVRYRNDATAYNELGEYLYRLKRMAESLQSHQRALELDPKDDRARRSSLYCLIELNHIREAREQGQQLLNDDPNSSTAFDCLSWCDFLDGKYQEAIKRCELGIRMGYYYLYDTCARALYKTNAEDQALTKYDEAFKGRTGEIDILFNKVVLLMEMNRYQEALPILENIVKEKPEHAYANHNLAAIPYDRGRYEEAYEKWLHAVKVYKQQGSLLTRAIDEGKSIDTNEAYNHASVVFYVLHKPDEAARILKEGLGVNPNNTLILGLLATIYWENKEEVTVLDAESSRQKTEFHKLGLECFQRAERLLRERSDRYLNYNVLVELGDLYLLHEDYKNARDCFEQAKERDSKAYLPYAKLGIVYLRDRKPDKAIPLLLEALERNPDDLDTKSSLAEAYLRAEKLNDAEMSYRQVLNLAPNHVQSSIGLGELCSVMGDKKDYDRYSEAVDLFSRALELAENEKARSKYLKKTEKAAVYYQIGYARAQCYENSGIRRDTRLLDQARRDFEQCIALNPSHQKAIRAKEKIDKRLAYFRRDRLTETVGPRSIYRMSLAVFVAVQIAFFVAPFLNRPSLRVSDRAIHAVEKDLTAEQLESLKAVTNKQFSSREMLSRDLSSLPGKIVDTVLQNVDAIKPVENAPDLPASYYALLTFGLLLFMVVGLYLPQILKLKVAGIELEKSSIDQAAVGDQAFANLGIGKP